MKLFIDTANIWEIQEAMKLGVIAGCTTNQKIFSVEKDCNFKERVREILRLVDGPVSIELATTNQPDNELVGEAVEYASWSPDKVIVKVPMWGDGRGLRIVKELKKRGIRTNMTCMVTLNQILLAVQADATYVSFFFNRARDVGIDAVKTIKDSMALLKENCSSTELIVGSIRKPEDIQEIAVASPSIITIPYKILMALPFHQKTEDTIHEFDEAWKNFLEASNP